MHAQLQDGSRAATFARFRNDFYVSVRLYNLESGSWQPESIGFISEAMGFSSEAKIGNQNAMVGSRKAQLGTR